MRTVDRCPACDADALALHHDYDGDETGTWPVHWFECERCARYVSARYDGGDYWPVVEDEGEAAS